MPNWTYNTVRMKNIGNENLYEDGLITNSVYLNGKCTSYREEHETDEEEYETEEEGA